MVLALRGRSMVVLVCIGVLLGELRRRDREKGNRVRIKRKKKKRK